MARKKRPVETEEEIEKAEEFEGIFGSEKPEEEKKPEGGTGKPEEDKNIKKAKAKQKKNPPNGILKAILIGLLSLSAVTAGVFSVLNYAKIKEGQSINPGAETPVITDPSGGEIVTSTKISEDDKIDVLKNLYIARTDKQAKTYSNVEVLDAEKVVDENSKIAYVKMQNEKGQTLLCPITIECDSKTSTADAIKNGAKIVSGTSFKTFYEVDSLFNETDAIAVEEYVKTLCGDTATGTQAYVTKISSDEKTREGSYSCMTVSNDGKNIVTKEQSVAGEYDKDINNFYLGLAIPTTSQENERTK